MIIGSNIIGALLAFLVGTAIAAVNYCLSKSMLKKHPQNYPASQILRQMLQIAYLVVLFTLGKFTPWNRMWLLVGGCIGITLPMFFFTWKLVKMNESLKRKEDPSDG